MKSQPAFCLSKENFPSGYDVDTKSQYCSLIRVLSVTDELTSRNTHCLI